MPFKTDIDQRNQARAVLRAFLAVLSALMLLTVGCTSHMPPGFRQAGPGIQSILDDNVPATVTFALTEWYAKGCQPFEIRLDALPAVNQLNREARKTLLRQNLIATFGCSQPPLLVLQDGIPTIPSDLLSGSCDEAAQISTEYTRCLALFETACAFTVSPDDCLKDEYWTSRKDRKRFAAWLADKQFTYSELKDEDSEVLLNSLHDVQQCADLKCALLRTIDTANSLLAKHRGLEAMPSVTDENLLKAADAPLEKYGAGPALAAYRQFCQEYPARFLSAELETLAQKFTSLAEPPQPEAEQAFSRLEKEFSSALTTWQTTPALADCLAAQNAKQMSDLISQFAQKRSRLWSERLEELAQSGDYYSFGEFYSSCQKEIAANKQGALALYASDAKEARLDQLKTRLLQTYRCLLPGLLNTLYSLADDAANINGKPGASLLLGRQFLRLVSLAGDAPLENELPLLCERAASLQACNMDTIRRKNFKRRLSIGDFASAQPALGMTYARDLAHTLETQLKAAHLEAYLSIATDDRQKLPEDDSILGGVIADFDGSEQLTRESTRSVLTHSAVRSVVNPDFIHAPAPGEAVSKLNAPVLFLQDEHEHVIHCHFTERQVHVRIFFTVKAGPASDLIELNEFYPRVFTNEQSHPQQDVRLLNTCSAFSEDSFLPPSSLPELLTERIWSTGEMLDYARKDSLQALAVKVRLCFRRHLLKQATEALLSSATSPVEAAEQFGRFVCALETFATLTQAESVSGLPTSSATCYQDDLQEFTRQQQTFRALAENVSDDACRLADGYLRHLRQSKAANEALKDTALLF